MALMATIGSDHPPCQRNPTANCARRRVSDKVHMGPAKTLWVDGGGGGSAPVGHVQCYGVVTFVEDDLPCRARSRRVIDRLFLRIAALINGNLETCYDIAVGCGSCPVW